VAPRDAELAAIAAMTEEMLSAGLRGLPQREQPLRGLGPLTIERIRAILAGGSPEVAAGPPTGSASPDSRASDTPRRGRWPCRPTLPATSRGLHSRGGEGHCQRPAAEPMPGTPVQRGIPGPQEALPPMRSILLLPLIVAVEKKNTLAAD